MGMSVSAPLNQKLLEEFGEIHGEGQETGTGVCNEIFVVNGAAGETGAEV